MNYLMIPFLLASQIIVHHDDWKHGPEYVFAVNMSMITDLCQDEGTLMGSHMTTKMTCQPKKPDILMCKLGNSYITKISPKAFHVSATIPDQNASYTPFGIGRTTFGIQFNEWGIKNILVEDLDPPVPYVTLNMFRLIANQLNIGAIPNLPQFLRLENSTVGECHAHIKLSRKSLFGKDWRLGREIDYLTIVPDEQFPRLSDGRLVDITKSVDPANCIRQAVYEFGTRYIYGIVLRDVINKLKSSILHTVVTENSFMSETMYESDLYDMDRENLGVVLDHVSLTLESINPAKDEVKMIPDALRKEIIVDNHEKMGTFF